MDFRGRSPPEGLHAFTDFMLLPWVEAPEGLSPGKDPRTLSLHSSIHQSLRSTKPVSQQGCAKYSGRSQNPGCEGSHAATDVGVVFLWILGRFPQPSNAMCLGGE